jgi:hypothetical protein
MASSSIWSAKAGIEASEQGPVLVPKRLTPCYTFNSTVRDHHGAILLLRRRSSEPALLSVQVPRRGRPPRLQRERGVMT